ncbi:MAG TPA: triphosphoribosyl-dephospho-CoA synthase [Vicinamibacterales bacterium]
MSVVSPRAAAVQVASMAQLACVLEASAPKPGNVSPGRPFHDLRYEDFVASAVAIGAAFECVGQRPLGQTVRAAIESTRAWTSTNTNLGIVLLLAPLARAAIGVGGNGVGSHFAETQEMAPDPVTFLRSRVREVLAETTVDDAREVYAAIRLAQPGGLGRADAQDVADEPTMTLADVMQLASDRDSVASEYATGFELTFTVSAPALDLARADGLAWDDAIVETFLALLAMKPDTHIARRAGLSAAEEVSRRARSVLDAGGVRSATGRQAIDDMDRALRDVRHTLNPGTTADLATAAIFVVLLARGFRT